MKAVFAAGLIIVGAVGAVGATARPADAPPAPREARVVAGAATWSDNASTYWAHLGSLSGQDIEAIAFLVLMQAAKETQEDLKAIMAKVKCTRVEKLADGAVVYAEAENVVDPSETYVLKVIDRAVGSRGILPDEAGVVRPPRPVPADDEYCGAYHVATAVVVGDFRAL